MKNHVWGTFAFCLLIHLAVFNSMEARAVCTPHFPFQNESNGTWLGGDGGSLGYSSPTRSYWAFGDTFVGRKGATNRLNASVIGNTIAIGVCKNGNWSLQYYWRGTNGRPSAFFDDGTNMGPGYRMWPGPQWFVGGQLFVSFTKVINAEGGLGFRPMGSVIARISNPNASPENWRIEYFQLADQFLPFSIGAAWLDQNWLYAYVPIGTWSMMVARIPVYSLVNSIPNLPGNFEYLSKTGNWVHGYNPADAWDAGFGASAGLSVRWNGFIGKWQAIYVNTKVFPTPVISMSVADGPFGPFVDEIPLYSAMGPAQPGSQTYDPTAICYSAMEDYPFEANTNTDIFLTYSCTNTNLEKVTRNLKMYFPVPVRLHNPFAN